MVTGGWYEIVLCRAPSERIQLLRPSRWPPLRSTTGYHLKLLRSLEPLTLVNGEGLIERMTSEPPDAVVNCKVLVSTSAYVGSEFTHILHSS